MKKYIVTQCCRCDYTEKETDANKGLIKPYKFSKDLAVGEYTEDEFISIVGKEFLENEKFEQYCNFGWIQVVQYKDVTKQTVSKFNKL